MALTYTAISTVAVGSGGAATIDFQSIPSTYTDLKLVLSARGASTALYALIRFNNNSSSIYSLRYLYGEGSGGIASGSAPNENTWERFLMVSSAYTADTFSNGELYIPNYTSSNNKSVYFDSVNERNDSVVQMFMVAGLFASTSVIDRITLTPNTGSFAEYTTATLYGIKNIV